MGRTKDSIIQKQDGWKWVAKAKGFTCKMDGEVISKEEMFLFEESGLCGRCYNQWEKEGIL